MGSLLSMQARSASEGWRDPRPGFPSLALRACMRHLATAPERGRPMTLRHAFLMAAIAAAALLAPGVASAADWPDWQIGRAHV